MAVYLLAIFFGGISAAFWGWESMEFISRLRALPRVTARNPFVAFGQSLRFCWYFIGAIFSWWPFLIDIAATVILVNLFSTGGSAIGVMLGLAISDVVSGFIMWTKHSVAAVT